MPGGRGAVISPATEPNSKPSPEPHPTNAAFPDSGRASLRSIVRVREADARRNRAAPCGLVGDPPDREERFFSPRSRRRRRHVSHSDRRDSNQSPASPLRPGNPGFGPGVAPVPRPQAVSSAGTTAHSSENRLLGEGVGSDGRASASNDSRPSRMVARPGRTIPGCAIPRRAIRATGASARAGQAPHRPRPHSPRRTARARRKPPSPAPPAPAPPPSPPATAPT